MEIPQNTYSEEDKIEEACKHVLEKLDPKIPGDWVVLTWTEFSQSVAHAAAKRFLDKGYHAASIMHMQGDGPNWFWYGVKISTAPISQPCARKTSYHIMG